MSKPLIVGELNPYGSDPRYALFPFPLHATGGRLRKILGLSLSAYMNGFDKMNLCTGRWSQPEARRKAAEVMLQSRTPIVLLGRKVAGAFFPAGPPEPFTVAHETRFSVAPVYLIPHPSGMCREWNDPQAIPKVRALLAPLLEAKKA